MTYLIASLFGLFVVLHHIQFDLGIERYTWGLRYVGIWMAWTATLCVFILVFEKEGLL